MKPARLLLGDAHALILTGIRTLLEPYYEVVGSAGDGRSLVGAALKLRPDLIILEVSMPILNGIDAARQIKKAWPEAKLLFLSMHINTVYLREALAAGGSGYLVKSAATKEELRPAIERVLKGQLYVTPVLVLAAALRVYCEDFRREGIKVEFTERDLHRTVSREIASCLYKVAQEGLLNVAKHAKTKQAWVTLEGAGDRIRLRVEDRGSGFAVESLAGTVGLGVRTMKERVRFMNGNFEIHSNPGQGTRISVDLPVVREGR